MGIPSYTEIAACQQLVLGWVIVLVNDLPRGAQPSGIFKIENTNEGHHVMHPIVN